jgi:VanZ family protein
VPIGRNVRRLFQAGFWIPLIICTYLALVPEPPEHPVFRLSDVILHAGAFTYLTFALVLAGYPGESRGRLAVRSSILMLGYGVFLELAQMLVPERSAEVKDLIVDLAGIGIGLGLAWVIAAPVHDTASRLLSRI